MASTGQRTELVAEIDELHCSWNLSLKIRSAVGRANRRLGLRNAPTVSQSCSALNALDASPE
jgi:hypothetical protein